MSLAVACRGGSAPGSKSGPDEDKISASPRSFLIQEGTVVLEGRWGLIGAGPEAPVVPSAVRVVCVRTARSCREDLTRPSTYPGAEPVHDVLQYRVSEWTKEGEPAAKLVASRREGASRVEIRVYLSGLAAEKVVIDKGGETRSRLE